MDVLGAAVGNLHGPTTERVFVGPKELEVLQKSSGAGRSGADNDLNGLVDFGWWGIIAKPLFVWLKWTYQHIVPNWGWAIVLQTLIISRGAAAAAHHADEVDAEDAARGAADQGDPGEVQEVQHAGSAQGADE